MKSPYLICFALLAACAPGAGGDTDVPSGTPWSEPAEWGSGPGDGTWAYRTLAAPAAADYALEFSFRVEIATTNTAPVHQLDSFASYNNQEDLGGYEAAAVLRRGPEGQYRFQFSSLWREVLLWSSRGGILQVRPFPFAAGQVYRVRARVAGPHLRLSIDGQEVIDHWDTTAPVRGGAPALARKEGTTWLSAATVTPLFPEPDAQAPPHRPRFSLRWWKGLRWGFDGDELLFALGVPVESQEAFPGSDAVAFEVKLVPGYAAQLFVPLFFENVTDDLFALSVLKDLAVSEQGARLSFTLLTTDRGPRRELTGRTTVTLSYDPAENVYRYDQRGEITVPEGATVRASDNLRTGSGCASSPAPPSRWRSCPSRST